ncbi:UxaA family hydrolase [Natronorarus salvus]|uniref:UxaA family hydrolase n=1 Tax=Natronorarus salvus TaxID=3117733 RepID=UPI002F265EC4
MKGRVLDECALLMTERDTVATALEDLESGREIALGEGESVALREPVPFGHKVAVTAIDAGDRVRKYGEVIGEATERIEPGAWVHTHNCESTRGRGDVASASGAVTEGERR